MSIDEPEAVRADDHFGSDFVAFLLIIYGGMGVVGGFFWLLYVIIEAVR
jgi:hypothetical protein